VRTSPFAWSLAGIVAGVAGLATSYFASMAMTIRDSPVVAVAELVIRLTPGPVAERAIRFLGHLDKPALVLVILVFLALVFAYAGRLARRSWWLPAVVYAVLAAVGVVAVATQPRTSTLEYLPIAVGFATWLICLSLMTEPLRRAELAEAAADGEAREHTGEHDRAVDELRPRHVPSRRGFLFRAGVLTVASVVVAGFGRVVGTGRRHVEETRRLLRLSGVTEPKIPFGARIGLKGVSAWQTSNDGFYQIHTTIVVPTIEPRDWTLRIHGMVDREVELTYDQLLARRRTEAWITLNCVSNEVGGDLIGNAWWSGVRVADLLRLAGVQEGADAVLPRSEDGWTCGTPLTALTDDRNAMLAVAMNGQPLPIDHGFPVRTIVPGLYGYVSACKWVVDMEVTRFADFEAFWTERGWGERGPVKIASRIDVPKSGDEVPAGDVAIGGVAWEQQTGIEGVEVAIDGEEWRPAQLGRVPNEDTWVQWALTLDVEPGEHTLRVRAIGRDGKVQTGVERDVLPDGATGWHTIDFTATE
jgi:DMSO/TMAO reductase YedYZ molybdopterin-dependent catalytic subunit